MTTYERAVIHETIERLAAYQETLAQQIRELQIMLDVGQMLEHRPAPLPLPSESVR